LGSTSSLYSVFLAWKNEKHGHEDLVSKLIPHAEITHVENVVLDDTDEIFLGAEVFQTFYPYSFCAG
jgi:hypothetical protein